VVWAQQSFTREMEENPEIKFVLIRLRKKNNSWIWCMVRGHNLLKTPQIEAIAVYIHDDTLRKQATDALKESEKRFRTLIRDLRIGVLLQDAEGTILMTNKVMITLFALSEEEILGGKIWELYTDVIHEDGTAFLVSDRPSFKAMQTRQLVQDVVMGVWQKERKERIWIMISADPVLDAGGEVVNIICSFTDITERKKLEKKIFAKKLAHQRQLTQATIDGQEKERLEIGRELHDNIGQQLTSVKLFLDLAKNASPAEGSNMVELALKSISAVIDEVRSMSRSLVPPSLKDLGFVDSVNDLIETLRTTQSIAFTVDYLHFDESRLPENKKLALFRIVQEQLNNIVKHAAAPNVFIGLSAITGQVVLKISDNGQGFDLKKVKRGLGLTNITNRAELFGGRVEIITSPGNGCTVNVYLPHIVMSGVFQ
ncbi:MAG TPA: PAS domain S-box protein, partial [Flavisolibacter sp.]|nr:PAS domain S-box protein [Flavisolibacter sp.]